MRTRTAKMKATAAAYYLLHKPRLKAEAAARYAADPESADAYQKAWQLAHAPQQKLYYAEYRALKREALCRITLNT